MSRTQRAEVNRELSWLDFNERVLISAEQENMPLLERLRFLGIFHSNLDEFYSVRVGSLHRLLVENEQNSMIRKSEIRSTISAIHHRVTDLNQRSDTLFSLLRQKLAAAGVRLLLPDQIGSARRAWLDDYFHDQIRARIFPIMLRKSKDFPFLQNLSTYLAVTMQCRDNEAGTLHALIEIPENLPRFIGLPPDTNPDRAPSPGPEAPGPGGHPVADFVILDDVIRSYLPDIFHALACRDFAAYAVTVTRDAEYSLDDEVTKSLYERLSLSIRQRSSGAPVRVVYDRDMPESLWKFISQMGQLEGCQNSIAGGRYHDIGSFVAFPAVDGADLYFQPQPPLPHGSLDNSRSLIAQVLERDHLISLPYHRFGYMLDLLREAAIDPLVTSIKMTLYRVADDSSIVNALISAARNGKKVTVFIEVQARFNEEANLYWTEQLSSEPNVTLISSLEGMKVHSKICVIHRKAPSDRPRFEPEGETGRPQTRSGHRRSAAAGDLTEIRSEETAEADPGRCAIAVISTGNFNERTARLYSDLMLITADRTIAEEVNKVFKLLGSSFRVFKFNDLLVAPFSLRSRMVSLIKREIDWVKKGREGELVLKLNNLVDDQLIRWLLKAASAGVSVTLLIRGICCLRAGIPGRSEGITVRAVIDRYLEHARILRFGNGGNREYYIGSADLMPRNLNRRIETLVPVRRSELKDELETYLSIHLQDTYSTFINESETVNCLLRTGAPAEVRAQQHLYRYYAGQLSHRAPAAPPGNRTAETK